MQFELVHGPVYFAALMQKIPGQLNDFHFFHMDAVLVHGSNVKDHLECLKMIFLKIREAGLKLKL